MVKYLCQPTNQTRWTKRKKSVSNLDLCEVEHGLLIGDDVKINRLPHSMAQEAAHVPLLGNDNEVHPYAWRDSLD